jgi:hypothetical protein
VEFSIGTGVSWNYACKHACKRTGSKKKKILKEGKYVLENDVTNCMEIFTISFVISFFFSLQYSISSSRFLSCIWQYAVSTLLPACALNIIAGKGATT